MKDTTNCSESVVPDVRPPLSRLEYFAGLAMQGLLATGKYEPGTRASMDQDSVRREKIVATLSRMAAEALCAELEKEKP